MSQFIFLGTMLSALGLPLLAIIALMHSKLVTGRAAVGAQRRFLAFLVVMTIVTAHTVTTSGPTWLIHTLTLSLMVVGSLWIPDPSHTPTLESSL